MIVRVMDPAGPNFPGVHYNDKKIDKGTGELMLMKNFPSFINESSSKEEVRNYLRAISIGNQRVQKPQFHAMISTKFQGHSKEELTKIAENFMDEMKYGKQPFIVVFHKDTDNNHVHIVSTRVDKQTGKKINDSYEKLKAQKALSVTMEKLYGQKPEEELEKLLNYKISSLSQLETLLNRNGYKIGKNTNDENSFNILKNGVIQQTLSGNQIVFDNSKNEKRVKQIKAILSKYKELYSNKVFKVEDNRKNEAALPKEKTIDGGNDSKMKIAFESELQKKLKDVFGIDMVFHHKEDKNPFGYTAIDYKTLKVYKGSDLLKMNEVFEFTSDKLDKKTFEILKDYNIRSQETKNILLEFFKKNNPETEIKDFMLFENRAKKDLETYRRVQFEVKDFIRNNKNTNDEKKDISITAAEDGKLYAVHTRFHYVGELQQLIGEKEYQKFLNPQGVNEMQTENRTENNEKSELNKAVNEMLFELMKSSGTTKDPAENELKKRRKKRR
ncbi:relaxase/mobilization nuclease domain-containing protein [Chryseobacterium sp. Ch-15]|uniref:Relaxase/mobilization nuclease domain-containing protein n=1 Tax=Chryseobacterium muglaense TaxID=2893752 RepID=A0A9Q3V0G0_9FLAO|nr:relaxase/mobilization nuclease domain-containing protein [Chryseobacterium muglaense]MBD3903375.1 relaxase/mobilization nuclease domain-containing protein [Chryseobacterium muglaense]MCC9036275.1 relaxase/mobilization nuclease domain-containing protein [Chryseobacterium muglaense]MCM2554846.1 relaxase/mobilization nuclease domain-containing protein [Chryseobacterium muglaense]